MTFEKGFRKLQFCFLILFINAGILSASNDLQYAPLNEGPLQVSVSIHINNIFNINTVDETYQVDGYLVYKWRDERMKFTPDSCLNEPRIYINNRARNLIATKLWFPNCEYINVRGNEDCPNIRIEISPEGNILYTERFFKTFFSNMDFKSFPFDCQYFNIVITPWGYNYKKVILTDPNFIQNWKRVIN